MEPAQDNSMKSESGTGGFASGHLNVLVNFPLEDPYIRRVEAVDPRVRVKRTQVPRQATEPGSSHAGEWESLEGEELDALLSEAEVLFTFHFSPEWLPKAPNLKWVQLASAGSDFLFREGVAANYPGLTVTTASGVHAIPISEHIVAMILHFSRYFDRVVRNQAARKWERLWLDEAHGKTVLLVGYGAIARRAALLCAALGMRVLAVRASLLEQQPGFEGVERFYPLEELEEMLTESDYVVVAAPRTSRSEGMIGRKQFAAMKEGAVLINISRGALVDEEALVEALRAGKLRGAGLDVFAQEPLPESSPLWEMPNVLITPHVSGSNPHYYERATEIFCENLVHYLRGEGLKNLVMLERGY